MFRIPRFLKLRKIVADCPKALKDGGFEALLILEGY